MKIEDIMKEWEEDSKVSPFDLAGEAIKTSSLHAKYMRYLLNFNMKSKKLNIDYREKREWKRRYFKGEFNNPNDLKLYNIEPYRHVVINADIQSILDADVDLNKILLSKEYNEECAKFCESVIKEISNRSYAIGNAIKWNVFQGGG